MVQGGYRQEKAGIIRARLERVCLMRFSFSPQVNATLDLLNRYG